MTKRMLIDSTHAEETRVVVLDGSRLEDFDVETSTKKQLKGNIYLAKVVRVEPSLQAAFVEYGGNRHGFLAFGEIHPDYYQIPVADRQRLLAMEAEDARREEEEDDRQALNASSYDSSRTSDGAEDPTDESDTPQDPGVADTSVADTSATDAGATDAGATDAGAADAGSVDTGTADTDAADTIGAASASTDVPPSISSQPLRIETETVSGALDELTPVDAAEPLRVSTAATPAEPAHSPVVPDVVATLIVPAADTLAGDAIAAPIAAGAEGAAPDDAAADMVRVQAEAPEIRDTTDADAAKIGAAEVAAFDVETVEVADGDTAVAKAVDLEAGPSLSGDVEPDDVERADIEPVDSDSGEIVPVVADAGDADADSEADADAESISDTPPPETVGGDADTSEDARERRPPPRFLRNYKIQEVIRRRQILLVQVVKEERGTKGAALTTYISLAGRYCVLMPNSPRGGGISRKITSATDRRRLKEVTAELDIPQGMGLIVRTAGANRPKPEIKRDCEYLMRLWDDIREHTMKSVAPALIYEEASLIKRSIRDVYSRDIDEILVDGEEGWKSARDFMRMLMPSHVKKVQLWRESQPLFARQQVEAQLDAMMSPTVQLRSGGYLVINQTEALVAIDVNSGRSTRERGIEETALRTNCEAVDEVARQLRLRDLAGLIVIDLIDMESRKNNATVERRLKEALKNDRARIQVGHISHFGLMEMSRQRLRPSLAETSFVTCPHCGGVGHVRGTESSAIHVLRDIEEEGAKRRAAEILVRVASPIAMYVLNHKRARLGEIEARYAMHVSFAGDDTLIPPQVRIERVRAQIVSDVPAAITPDARTELAQPVESVVLADEFPDEDEDVVDVESVPGGEPADAAGKAAPAEGGAEAEAERRRRRRRRRRGGRREDGASAAEPAGGTSVAPGDGDAADALEADLEQHIEGVPEYADTGTEASAPDAGVPEGGATPEAGAPEAETQEAGPMGEGAADDAARGRRRGRRGGRRRRSAGDGALDSVAEPGAEQPELPPLYTGPTPADPFGGQAFDIFDVLEQAEQAADRPVVSRYAADRVNQPASSPIPDWAPTAGEEPKQETQPETAGVTELAEAELPTSATSEPASPTSAAPEPVVTAPSIAVRTAPTIVVPEPEVTASVDTTAKPAATAPIVTPAEPESVASVSATPEPEAASPIVPEPEPAPELAVDAPAPPVPANDATPEPLVKPIIIGADGDAPVVEKKRGWWRR